MGDLDWPLAELADSFIWALDCFVADAPRNDGKGRNDGRYRVI
jgi:hypothetical protein